MPTRISSIHLTLTQAKHLALCILWMFLALPKTFSQTEPVPEDGGEEEENVDFPLYVSAGPNYSRYSGRGFPIKFGYKAFGEGGIYTKMELLDNIPAFAGVEYQRKGYDIDLNKKGILQNGKAFEQTVRGKVRVDYLACNILGVLPIPRIKPFGVMLGSGFALRVHYKQQFNAVYKIPQDSLEIPSSYNQPGNDAMDFLDFNLLGGIRYRVSPRFDLWALASRKLFGFSLGTENFITSKEINTSFTFRLVYRLPDFLGYY